MQDPTNGRAADMTLYLTNSFVRSFSFFLSKGDIRMHSEQETAFFKSVLSLRESFRFDMQIEKIMKMIDLIGSSDFVDQERYDGYLRLKTELPELSESDLLNLYAVLFMLTEKGELSYPVGEILQKHYPEIVLRIVRDSITPILFRDVHELSAFQNAVYSILSDYVIVFCAADDLAVWGERYNDGSEPSAEPVQGHTGEEYEALNVYVHLTDRATVDRLKTAGFVAGYDSGDVDYGIMLIENMLTFATEDLTDAVTLQIIGHASFKSYEEMYHSLGTAAFGFPDKSPRERAAETEAFFEEYYPEGPLALKVKRLPRAILTKADFEEAKRLTKNKRRKKDDVLS